MFYIIQRCSTRHNIVFIVIFFFFTFPPSVLVVFFHSESISAVWSRLRLPCKILQPFLSCFVFFLFKSNQILFRHIHITPITETWENPISNTGFSGFRMSFVYLILVRLHGCFVCFLGIFVLASDNNSVATTAIHTRTLNHNRNRTDVIRV